MGCASSLPETEWETSPQKAANDKSTPTNKLAEQPQINTAADEEDTPGSPGKENATGTTNVTKLRTIFEKDSPKPSHSPKAKSPIVKKVAPKVVVPKSADSSKAGDDDGSESDEKKVVAEETTMDKLKSVDATEATTDKTSTVDDKPPPPHEEGPSVAKETEVMEQIAAKEAPDTTTVVDPTSAESHLVDGEHPVLKDESELSDQPSNEKGEDEPIAATASAEKEVKAPQESSSVDASPREIIDKQHSIDATDDNTATLVAKDQTEQSDDESPSDEAKVVETQVSVSVTPDDEDAEINAESSKDNADENGAVAEVVAETPVDKFDNVANEALVAISTQEVLDHEVEKEEDSSTDLEKIGISEMEFNTTQEASSTDASPREIVDGEKVDAATDDMIETPAAKDQCDQSAESPSEDVKTTDVVPAIAESESQHNDEAEIGAEAPNEKMDEIAETVVASSTPVVVENQTEIEEGPSESLKTNDVPESDVETAQDDSSPDDDATRDIVDETLVETMSVESITHEEIEEVEIVEELYESFETVETVVEPVDFVESGEETEEVMTEESDPSDGTEENAVITDESESKDEHMSDESDGKDSEDSETKIDKAPTAADNAADQDDAPSPKKKKRKKKPQRKKRNKRKKKKKNTNGSASVDGGSNAGVDLQSEEELESDALMELYTLLNVDPHAMKPEAIIAEQKIVDLLTSFPEYCSEKFQLEAFSESVYPLSILCSIGASVSTLTACWEAFPDAIEANDSYVGSPLHYACSYKASADSVRFLVEKNPTQLLKANRFYRLPLHMACMFDADPAVVAYLASQSPESATKLDVEGMTPLHIICDASGEATIGQAKSLVTSYPQVCSNPNASGDLPLHTAVSTKLSKELIQVLVDGCPETKTAENSQGETAHAIASRLELDESVLSLLSWEMS